MTNRCTPRGRARSAIIDGFAQGVLVFGALFAAEWMALGPDLRTILGSPLPQVISLYLLSGGVLGSAIGLFAWVAARMVSLRPAKMSFVVLAYLAAALFLLRQTPTQTLATFPPLLWLVLGLGVLSLLAGLGWSQRASAPRPRAGSLRFAAVAVACVACTATVAWVPLKYHRLPQRHAVADDMPNVVFVLVDALRADRLSCYGYPRSTTPFIDQIASYGTRFSNAYSHGNRTIIAMPSLLTSIYPSYTRSVGPAEWNVALPDSHTTLAEIFHRAGYTTLGMMSNPYLKRPFGLTQGFDRVEEFNSGRFHLSLYRVLMGAGRITKPHYADGLTANAQEVTNAAVSWLARTPRHSPFFCYVHYMDVHHPYLPPLVYDQMFNTQDWLESADPMALYQKTVQLVQSRQAYPLSPSELTRLSDLYDACIRYVDAEIARLVAIAEKRNGRRTIVVITSDHGDEFQEHGFLYHNNVVVEELIRVPLVVWRTGDNAPRRVDDLVRHVDVLPTLAEMVRVPVPARAIGKSLVPLMQGERDESPRVSIAEGDYCSALVEPGWKVMRVDTTDADVLYNLVADPAGLHDISSLYRQRFGQMRESLDLYFHGVPATEAIATNEVDAATLRQLRALGYIN